MTAENGGGGKRTERREMDSSPQESDAMSRYLDLKAAAYNPLMNKDERQEFAQNLIDLVKLLNEGDKIEPAVREDLLKQVQTIERDYILLQKIGEAVKQLERESRGGIQVPHLYNKVAGLIVKALEGGMPEQALEPFRKSILGYLREVRAQVHRR